MRPDLAQRVAARMKRSPKYNRKWRVKGILIAKGEAYIQVVSKKTGKAYNL